MEEAGGDLSPIAVLFIAWSADHRWSRGTSREAMAWSHLSRVGMPGTARHFVRLVIVAFGSS